MRSREFRLFDIIFDITFDIPHRHLRRYPGLYVLAVFLIGYLILTV